MINSQKEKEYTEIQKQLIKEICLENRLEEKDIKLAAGIDLAYWKQGDTDYAVCCIVIIDYNTHELIETKYLKGEINVPYIPGFLSFRELPLIMETYRLIENEPDIIIFDGNGYLHFNHMGIATHASFYLKKPTIGVAKSYLKIEETDFTMPDDFDGAWTDIVIHGETYGRVLRTHKGVKPIFVSCGNWIDLDTSVKVVLNFINRESRQPIPIRLADMETRKMRELLQKEGK